MHAVARQIDRAELEAALRGLDLYTTKDGFETIFLQLDKDGSGCLEASRKVIDLIPLVEVEAVESDEVSAENDKEAQVRILTKEDGKNRGRAYVYNMPLQDSAIWVASLKLAVKEACNQ